MTGKARKAVKNEKRKMEKVLSSINESTAACLEIQYKVFRTSLRNYSSLL
ncbi:MAG: hypothetical protein LBH00_03315 [Planctomycetaceae bacterium]|nr:hypothetical protein [Planctomycetaceae bacterium]